jgi:hypothetical protein
VVRTKIRITSIREENQERRERGEVERREAESSARLCPQGCEDIRSATLSPSSYCSTIFGEIASLSSSCAPNLVEVAIDPCVSFYIFFSKRGPPHFEKNVKRIGVLCMLIYYFF